MKTHAQIRVTVLDGRAGVEVISGEGCNAEFNSIDGQYQVVEEGGSLDVRVGVENPKINIFHPDLDYLITKGDVDPKKLKVKIAPLTIGFELVHGSGDRGDGNGL